MQRFKRLFYILFSSYWYRVRTLALHVGLLLSLYGLFDWPCLLSKLNNLIYRYVTGLLCVAQLPLFVPFVSPEESTYKKHSN